MPSGNFSFCGVDIHSLGLNYAPETTDMFVYSPTEEQAHIETFDAHSGGYFYGTWANPKTFILRCYFEEENIDKGIMSRIYSLFTVGKSGKLIFDRRPWCYYYATVTEPIQTDFTNYLNGLITITMQAMYPFARSDIMTNLRTDANHEMMMVNSAVFDKAGMALPTEYTMKQRTQVQLVNPGTVRAALGISISGNVGDGVIIENMTTKQKCKMVAITKGETTDLNKSVLVDPISGKTILTGAGVNKLAFKYHEYGFLDLAPSFPAIRNVYIISSYKGEVSVSNILKEDLTGKYIFVNKKWSKITGQKDKNTLIVPEAPETYQTEKTMIMSMNEITVTPITTMDIKISFIFKPTFA